MEITHIILMHDDVITCRSCNDKVLITPINKEGLWRCYRCNKEQQVAKINKKALLKAVWKA